MNSERKPAEIKIAFSTLGCPDWTWQELISNGVALGYDGVEIRLIARETDLLKVPELKSTQLAQRRRELSDAGFQVCGLASSVRFDAMEPAQRAEQVNIGRAYVDLAAELGAAFVRVFGDVLPEHATDDERRAAISHIALGLQQLGEYAEKSDVGIVIETHGDYSSSSVVAETLMQVESPAVGVLWDTHHPWRFYGEELHETYSRIGRWVRHTHWKDSVTLPEIATEVEIDAAAQEAHTLMSGHRHADYVLFGGGEFPAEECLRLLIDGGYDGWFSLEWEKMWHPKIEDPEIALPLFPRKIRRLFEIVSTGHEETGAE